MPLTARSPPSLPFFETGPMHLRGLVQDTPPALFVRVLCPWKNGKMRVKMGIQQSRHLCPEGVMPLGGGSVHDHLPQGRPNSLLNFFSAFVCFSGI